MLDRGLPQRRLADSGLADDRDRTRPLGAQEGLDGPQLRFAPDQARHDQSVCAAEFFSIALDAARAAPPFSGSGRRLLEPRPVRLPRSRASPRPPVRLPPSPARPCAGADVPRTRGSPSSPATSRSACTGPSTARPARCGPRPPRRAAAARRLGVLEVHLGRGMQVEVREPRLVEDLSRLRHRVTLVRGRGVLGRERVDEPVRELLERQGDDAVTLRGCARAGAPAFRVENGSFRMPFGGAGLIATPARPRPRSSSSSTNRPP